MTNNYPNFIIGYHSCDKAVGLKVLNGDDDLIKSNNSWDWLGEGIYFWEQNPDRALEYANEVAKGKQFNNKKIKTPFILGAIIELGNCFNLLDTKSINVISKSFINYKNLCIDTNKPLPTNKGNNRALDCSIIKYVHQSIIENNLQKYFLLYLA